MEQAEELRPCNCGTIPVWETRRLKEKAPWYVEKRLVCPECHIYTSWCFRKSRALEEWENPIMIQLNSIDDEIDFKPPVKKTGRELVEVVRCKDCKHRPVKPDDYETGFDLEFPDSKCPCKCDDGYYSWYPNDNWFCAGGERKAD